MNNKIIIINGPNLNLLGEREQSQYGSTTYDQLKENCSKKAKEIGIDVEFAQSNVEQIQHQDQFRVLFLNNSL